MAYQTTKVPVARTQEHIRNLVLKAGGEGIGFFSQPPREGFEALVPIDGKSYRIRIVAVCESYEDQREADREVRRVWRVIFYHLKALYEAAQTGVLEFRELLLPYIVTKDDRTIAQHLLPQLDKAIGGSVKLLPSAPDDAR